MEIKNSNSIITSFSNKFQGIFDNFINYINDMVPTEQLNINSAEDLMNIFIKDTKEMLTSLIGTIFSNITNNSSNIIYDNGIKYKCIKKNEPITILTTQGKVTFERDYYYSRKNFEGFGENDKILEISDKHRMSKAVIEQITFAAQKDSSFKDASETLKRYLDIEVSIPQIQHISEEVGKLLFDEDMKAAEKYGTFQEMKENAVNYKPNPIKDENSILYIFADGSMLSTIGKNNWKEIKLGLILNKSNINVNSFENIEIAKKEYVSYLGNKETFAQKLYAAAKRAGLNEYTKVIVLGDGAPWIWDMFDTLFPGCTKILDFYHFKENINEYAKWIYSDDEITRKRWVNKIIELSMKNHSDKILYEIDNLNIESKERPNGIVNLQKYISEKQDMIKYGEYEKNGYIIGSGAIESGNKVVIQQRLKQSGMHWSIEGAQYISTLRTKYKSDLWYKVIRTIFEKYMVS